ncbi:hypothetical protein [Nocardia sp. NPDC004123]
MGTPQPRDRQQFQRPSWATAAMPWIGFGLYLPMWATAHRPARPARPGDAAMMAPIIEASPITTLVPEQGLWQGTKTSVTAGRREYRHR